MKKNVGKIDRIIRFVIAAVMAVLIITGAVEGTTAIVLGIIGGIMLVTGLIGFCGLYTICGFGTCPIKEKK